MLILCDKPIMKIIGCLVFTLSLTDFYKLVVVFQQKRNEHLGAISYQKSITSKTGKSILQTFETRA